MGTTRVLVFLALVGLAAGARGDVFTVGPDASYPSVTAALIAAQALPGPHEIRLESGDLFETTSIVLGENRQLEISGGWNDDFTLRVDDPHATIWHAVPTQNLLIIALSGSSSLDLSNLSLVEGSAGPTVTAGLDISLDNSSELTLQRVIVRSHVASTGFGVGLRANVRDQARLDLIDSEIRANLATGLGPHHGIGVFLSAQNEAFVRLRNSAIFKNQDTQSASVSFGVGMEAQVYDQAILQIDQCAIEANETYANEADGVGLNVLHNGQSVSLNRSLVVDQVVHDASAGGRSQVVLIANPGAQAWVTNSLIARSNGAGLRVTGSGNGAINLLHLTIADHAKSGLYVDAASNTEFANSILHGNAAVPFIHAGVVQTAVLGSDLNGVDPQFVNAPDDYHLAAASPGIDTGSAIHISSLFDLDGNAREQGGGTDLGAYELTPDAVFGDGFEAP